MDIGHWLPCYIILSIFCSFYHVMKWKTQGLLLMSKIFFIVILFLLCISSGWNLSDQITTRMNGWIPRRKNTAQHLLIFLERFAKKKILKKRFERNFRKEICKRGICENARNFGISYDFEAKFMMINSMHILDCPFDNS